MSIYVRCELSFLLQNHKVEDFKKATMWVNLSHFNSVCVVAHRLGRKTGKWKYIFTHTFIVHSVYERAALLFLSTRARFAGASSDEEKS